jgi:2,5-diketo-D-gluconate reductase A
MQDACRSRKLRAIGVSNFQPDRLMDIAAFNEIKPAVNQIEVNPFQQQTESLAFMRDLGVQAEAWAPFAEGRNSLFQNPLLQAIAKKHERTIGQVVLRWVVQLGVVPLAKSVRKERMVENLAIFDFDLDVDDITRIGTLDTGTSSFFSHRDPSIVKRMSERKLDI